MAKRVSQEDIINMNRIYAEVKTYAETARQTGFAASTVKKYIIPNWGELSIYSDKEYEVIHFTGPLPPVDVSLFDRQNWGELCIYSDEEYKEIRQLWMEVLI